MKTAVADSPVQIWDLETQVPFSQSCIWNLQRHYFEEMGTEAWRQGEVPHYATTNLRQANAYAEMMVALYKDHSRQHADVADPIYILELGAGSGRLAYYILRRLQTICTYEDIPITAFRYILTDFTQSNLDFWRIHPRFLPYFESGLLDIALFDAIQPAPLQLQISGNMLGPCDCKRPPVIIANYVWDSIPQDLVAVYEGKVYAGNVSISLAQDPATLTVPEILMTARLDYSLDTDTPAWMEDPTFASIMDVYRAEASGNWILFPRLAMECLAYLRTLSGNGILLLTADKGGHRLDSVAYPEPPAWTTHGSFSLNVNYHALQQYCVLQGGIAFFPDHAYHSINTGCLLLLDNAAQYTATRHGSQKHLGDMGPDTYFVIYKCVRTHLATVELRDIMAALRLSLYDSHQLNIFMERVLQLAYNLQPQEVSDLLPILHACWENYFPLAEELDFATRLGSICYAADAYDWAIFYFSQSTDIYGPYTGTLYNIAVCHHMLGNSSEAQALLEKVVAHDPENHEALAILAQYAEKTSSSMHT
jgi:hypothetical protein